MFLSGSVVGMSIVTSTPPIFPNVPYDTVKIFGSGIFDKIWIRNKEIDEGFLGTIDTVFEYNPVWDADTVFLAEFDSNLTAGNVEAGGGELIGWLINKRKSGDLVTTRVGEVDKDTTELVDYRVVDKDSVVYQIVPKTETVLGTPLETEEVLSEYDGWFLIDEQTNTTYKFRLQFSSDTASANTSQVVFRTHNKFPTISQTESNYITGGISAIVPEEVTSDGKIVQSVRFVEGLQDFIGNGKPKLLKSRKGKIMRVMTNGFSYSQVDDSTQEQTNSISFSFTEIERL